MTGSANAAGSRPTAGPPDMGSAESAPEVALVESAPEVALVESAPEVALVRSVMSAPVLAVTVDSTLQDALAALVNTGLRHLAVVDASGHCRGLLADRAIAAVWVRDPGALARRRVADLVSGHPPAVHPQAPVTAVARIMVHSGVDAVPVVDATGHLVGIVTTTDLVRALAEQMGDLPQRPAGEAGRPPD